MDSTSLKRQFQPASSAFLSLARSILVYSRKTAIIECCMLLGYSFKSRPKSHALSTAGSVMTSNFINKWMLALKNQFDERNKIDQFRNPGCCDFKGLMRFRQRVLLSFWSSRPKVISPEVVSPEIRVIHRIHKWRTRGKKLVPSHESEAITWDVFCF